MGETKTKEELPMRRMNSERDNWQHITSDDATVDELELVHFILGHKPDWMTDENWRSNMRCCAERIRAHVARAVTFLG